MKAAKFKKNNLNEKGQLTLEFMFAIILVIAVSTLLGILTFTLSLTEALQYITFSGARSYFAADMDSDTQIQTGNAKAQKLLQSLPFLSGAQASGWITVTTKGQGAGDYSAYRNSINVEALRNQFQGYQLNLTVPMMNVQIPFLNQMVQPPDGAQDFGATLSSFLTREPTFTECRDYLTQAYTVILKNFPTVQALGSTSYTVIIDNGC